MVADRLILDIRDGLYPQGILDAMSRITGDITKEIDAVRGSESFSGGGVIEDTKSEHQQEVAATEGRPENQVGGETVARPSESERGAGLVQPPREHSALPSGQGQQFWRELCEFLEYDPREREAGANPNVRLLPEIYKAIAGALGGLYVVMAGDRASKATLEEMLPSMDPDEAIILYQHYLFHWERFLVRGDLSREEAKKINPFNLEEPKVIDFGAGPSGKIVDAQAIYDSPVVLIRNFSFKKEEEIMEYFLSAGFGRRSLTCKPQDPTYAGLLPAKSGKGSAAKEKKEKEGGSTLVKVRDFISGYYLEEVKEELGPGKTFYGFGVDMNDEGLLGELDGEFKRRGLEGISPISGVFPGLTGKNPNPNFRGINTPEVLIKLEGAWTGGHTEYLGVRAANVQLHGKGRSTWICVPGHQSLRSQILERDKYDIRKHETEWFLELDVLLTYKEKVIIVHQGRVGDLVLLGPEVLHWVRAKGKAICIAWNLVLGKAKEMNTCFRNLEAADSNWSNIVPVYWYAQECAIQGLGEGVVEPGCRILFARKLVRYHTEEWEALLTIKDICWGNKPIAPGTFPAFCGKKGCSREVINLFISGYCVRCASASKGWRKASYFLPKGTILSKLGRILGKDDPELMTLVDLSQKVQGMP